MTLTGTLTRKPDGRVLLRYTDPFGYRVVHEITPRPDGTCEIEKSLEFVPPDLRVPFVDDDNGIPLEMSA